MKPSVLASFPFFHYPPYRYPVDSVYMMRRIIDEAERWKVIHPELVLPREAKVASDEQAEGIASAAVHAAESLSELIARITRPGTQQ